MNCRVCATDMDGNAGVTCIEVKAAVMVTAAEPDFVESSVLVAVMDTGLVEGTALGAV